MIATLSKPDNSTRLETAHPLILASASPRRSEIMRELGFTFEVMPAEIDEESIDAEGPAELAKKLAEMKAQAVADEVSETSCVVAADTVVAFQGRSLGKPESNEHAITMLTELSGNTHDVHTGIAVRAAGFVLSGIETTQVTMRDLERSEIEEYVKSGAAMDKAGAYGIQDSDFSPVESYKGSYSNVVGLPVGLLAELLLKAEEINEPTVARIRRSDA